MPASRPRAAVLTISDSAATGRRKDLSGPAVAKALKGRFDVVAGGVIRDERRKIEAALRTLAAQADLVVTTGGTGVAPRDLTPEATRAVCSRLLPGIPEYMRAEGRRKTPYAALSRAECGVCGKTLILNLPGNPAGAVDSLQSVLELLTHVVDLLHGRTEHARQP